MAATLELLSLRRETYMSMNKDVFGRHVGCSRSSSSVSSCTASNRCRKSVDTILVWMLGRRSATGAAFSIQLPRELARHQESDTALPDPSAFTCMRTRSQPEARAAGGGRRSRALEPHSLPWRRMPQWMRDAGEAHVLVDWMSTADERDDLRECEGLASERVLVPDSPKLPSAAPASKERARETGAARMQSQRLSRDGAAHGRWQLEQAKCEVRGASAIMWRHRASLYLAAQTSRKSHRGQEAASRRCSSIPPPCARRRRRLRRRSWRRRRRRRCSHAACLQRTQDRGKSSGGASGAAAAQGLWVWDLGLVDEGELTC